MNTLLPRRLSRERGQRLELGASIQQSAEAALQALQSLQDAPPRAPDHWASGLLLPWLSQIVTLCLRTLHSHIQHPAIEANMEKIVCVVLLQMTNLGEKNIQVHVRTRHNCVTQRKMSHSIILFVPGKSKLKSQILWNILNMLLQIWQWMKNNVVICREEKV